jgi:hypothetical protein
MTIKIHKFLSNAGFVKCQHPHHHERGYTLKHHKHQGIIQLFFNSFELLYEADKVLIAQSIKAVKSLPYQSKGCFLSVELNQESQKC